MKQGEFLHYAHARRVQAALFDRTNGTSPGYSQRLNGSSHETYGLAKSLAVMPGDVINAEVYVKYADPESSSWNTALTNLMLAIANNTGGIVVDGEQYTTAITQGDFPEVVNTGSSSATAPKAFLNCMVFDADFQFLDGGFVPVTTAARETGTDIPHERLARDNIVITKPGYVYIYLSNENGELVEVYWDDFTVKHKHGPVVQGDEYYPFGLTFNSYQRANSKANKYLYNSKALEDQLDIGWYDYQARQYDPVTGRFMSVDPAGELMRRVSVYAYAFNNPVRFTDPDGMVPEDQTDGEEDLEKWVAETEAEWAAIDAGANPFEVWRSRALEGKPRSKARSGNEQGVSEAEEQQGGPCPKCSNAWVKDVKVGADVGFFRTSTTSLKLMTADDARTFLNDQETKFEDRATFFSRASYALGLLTAKADWKVGVTIGTIGFIGGEIYGDIAQRYDSVEALIKGIHSHGVYIKIVDATSFGPRSTLTTREVSVYTYDGQLIGQIGY